MKTFYLGTFLFLLHYAAFSQLSYNPQTPEEAIHILQAQSRDSVLLKLSQLPEDEAVDFLLDFNRRTHFYHFTSTWFYSDEHESYKIWKHFKRRGISYPLHMRKFLAQLLYRKLLNISQRPKELFAQYKKIEKAWEQEDKIRYETDTLRGIYIPKDVEDCVVEIDKMVRDSTKYQILDLHEDEFAANQNQYFGRILRNNWQLWNGSRLSQYFSLKGIQHPEAMSGFILKSYHRYLAEKTIDLPGQIQQYFDRIAEHEAQYNQKTPQQVEAEEYLEELGLSLNEMHKVDPNLVVYDCDSTFGMKEMKGDTISYWVFAAFTLYPKNLIPDLSKHPRYAHSIFISEISRRGDFFVTFLEEKAFITKGDTLYVFDSHLKPIFSPQFFTNSTTYHTSRDPSICGDVITLDKYWKIKKDYYFQFTVSNSCGTSEIAFTYTLDADYNILEYDCRGFPVSQLTDKKSRRKPLSR